MTNNQEYLAPKARELVERVEKWAGWAKNPKVLGYSISQDWGNKINEAIELDCGDGLVLQLKFQTPVRTEISSKE